MDGPRVGQMEQDRTSHVEGSSLSPFLIPHPSPICQAESLSVKLQNGSTLDEKAHSEVNGNHPWLNFKPSYGTKHTAKGNASNRISPDLLQEKRDCMRYMQNGGIKRTFSEPSLYGLHRKKKLKSEEAKGRGDASLDSGDQPSVSNSCSERDFEDFTVEKDAASVLIQSAGCNCGAPETPGAPEIQNEEASDNINCHNRDTVLLCKSKAMPMPNGAIVSASSVETTHGERLEKTLSPYNPDHVSIAMQKTTPLTNVIHAQATDELACGTPPSSHTSGQISSPQTSNSELPQVLTAAATEVHNKENSGQPAILPASYTFQNPEPQLQKQHSEETHQSPIESADVPGTMGQVPNQNFALPNQDFSLSSSSNLKVQSNSSERLAEPVEENGALFQNDSIFQNSFSPPMAACSSPTSELHIVLPIGPTEGQNSYDTTSEETHLKEKREQHRGEFATHISGLVQETLSSQQTLQEKKQVSQPPGSESDQTLTDIAPCTRQGYPKEMKTKLEPWILGNHKELQQYQHLLGQIDPEIHADNKRDQAKDQMQRTHLQSQSPWAGMTSPPFRHSESPQKSNEVLLRTMLQLQSKSMEPSHSKQYPGSPDALKRVSQPACYQSIVQCEQIPPRYKSKASPLPPSPTADQQTQSPKHSTQSTKMNPLLKSHEQQQNAKHFHFQPQAERRTELSLEAQLKPQHLTPPPVENEQLIRSHILQQMLQSQPTQLPQSPQVTLNTQQSMQMKNRDFPYSHSSQGLPPEGTSFSQLKLEESFETANSYFKSVEFPVQNMQNRTEQGLDVDNKEPLYNPVFKANTATKHSYPNNMHLVAEKKENAMSAELFAENVAHDLQHRQYYPKQDVPQCFQEQKPQPQQTSALQSPFQQMQGYPHLNANMLDQQTTHTQPRYLPCSQQAPSPTVDQRACNLPPQPQRDFPKHAALRWHILNKQEQQMNQNKSETYSNLGHKPIKTEAASRLSACLRPPSTSQLENKIWKKTIKQEVQHSGCENMQQKSIIETMEQQLKQIQVKTLFDHKSLAIKSPKNVKVETSGPITVLSRNSTAADFSSLPDQQTIHSYDKTPTKKTAGSALNNFLESPSKLLDTPVKNLLDTPIKTQYDFPSCSCVGKSACTLFSSNRKRSILFGFTCATLSSLLL